MSNLENRFEQPTLLTDLTILARRVALEDIQFSLAQRRNVDERKLQEISEFRDRWLNCASAQIEGDTSLQALFDAQVGQIVNQTLSDL